ncbi:alpha/beta fold hydrolase [Rhizobium gallicum]|uniref:alpha/beta fold hydrolase n=1 Tax=Rhizobium gallicum TaxID=56730 RepID=UPI00389A0200
MLRQSRRPACARSPRQSSRLGMFCNRTTLFRPFSLSHRALRPAKLRPQPAECRRVRYGLCGNTTWHLVDDIERLRLHVDVEAWVIFANAWGSTLALACGESHPDRVRAMAIAGVTTTRRTEIRLALPQHGTLLSRGMGAAARGDTAKPSPSRCAFGLSPVAERA